MSVCVLLVPGSMLIQVKGIPSGEILSLESALNQAQVKHRRTLKKINTPGIGDIPLFNLTAKFDKTTAEVESPPPTLGQHTEELLKHFGYSNEDIKAYKGKGII
jgi:crotonobetainyl-CoA:carnitine CoA-transferase CaiB-like acyl-CoA transferase